MFKWLYSKFIQETMYQISSESHEFYILWKTIWSHFFGHTVEILYRFSKVIQLVSLFVLWFTASDFRVRLENGRIKLLIK